MHELLIGSTQVTTSTMRLNASRSPFWVSVIDERKGMWLTLFYRIDEKSLVTLRPHGYRGSRRLDSAMKVICEG